MFFSLKVLFILSVCYSSCFALRGQVNVTNKVVQNDTIAVDVFDEVGTGGIETEITCNLLEYEIVNCISIGIDKLKLEIDQGAHKRNVKILITSPSKVLFDNLVANHTYYLYCYSNQNTAYSKRICDTREEITTYLYKTPIPLLTFLPPFTSQVIINVNPQILHGSVYCDKYHYGIPPDYPVWVDNLDKNNMTSAKTEMLRLAEIKINCDELSVLDYNITYESESLIQGSKYNLFCFGTNDGYYSDFYTVNISTKPGMPTNGMQPTYDSHSVVLSWNYPKNYNASELYYNITEFRIEISNTTWNDSFTLPITDLNTIDFSHKIENLRPGTQYYYSIYAVDDNEDFPEDDNNNNDFTLYDTDIYRIGIPLSSSFRTLPSAPDKMYLNISNIEARRANGSWEEPYNGGSPILQYHVWISQDSTVDKESNYITVSTIQLYYIFVNLNPATAYYVSVRASTAIYNGEWSTEIYEFETLPDKPDPPTNPTIKWNSKDNLLFEWIEGSNNGDTVSNFTICPSIIRNTQEISLTCVYKTTDVKTSSYLYNTSDLEIGDIVRYRIAATNDYGTSSYSVISELFYYDVPDEYIKSQMQCINSDTSKTEITLNFRKHVDTLNKPTIMYYNISYYADSLKEMKNISLPYDSINEISTYTVTGLSPGENIIYYFSVCNDLGCNTEVMIECQTDPGKPDPPEFDLDRYYEPFEHKLNWTEPFHTGGLPIIRYIINLYEGGNINTFYITNLTDLSYIATSLKKNIEYCYTMKSENTKYQSDESARKCGNTAPFRPDTVISPYLIYKDNNPITLQINPEWNGGLDNRTIKIYYKTTPYFGYFEYEIEYKNDNNNYVLNIDLEIGKVYQILVLAYNECPEAELNYGKKLCGWSDIPTQILEIKTDPNKPDRIRELYHLYDKESTKGTVIFSTPDNNQAEIDYYTFYVCDYNNITDLCEYNYTYRIDTVYDYNDEAGFQYFNFSGLNNTNHKFALSSTNKIKESLKSLESVGYQYKKRVTDKPESIITISGDITSTCGSIKVEITTYPENANIFLLFGKNTKTNNVIFITQNYTNSFEYDLSSNLLDGIFVFFVSSCNDSGCSDFSLYSNEINCEIIPTTEIPTTTAIDEPTTTAKEEVILIMPEMIIIKSISFDKNETITIDFNIPEFNSSIHSPCNYSLYYYTNNNNNNQEDKKELLLKQNYTEIPSNITLSPVEYGIFYVFESYMENETEKTISLYNLSEIIVTTPTKPIDLNINNNNNNNNQLTWKNGESRGSDIINNTINIQPETGYICSDNNNNKYEIVLLPSLLSYDLNCYTSEEYNITIYSTNSIGKSEISTYYNYKPNIQLECNISVDSLTAIPNTTFISITWNVDSCKDIISYSIIKYKLYNTNQDYTEIETTSNNYIINYLMPFTFYEIQLSYAYKISGVEFETDSITKIVQTLSNSDVILTSSILPSIINIDNGFRIQFTKPISENYTIYIRINYTEGNTDQIIEEIKNDLIICTSIDIYQSSCYYDYNNNINDENSYMNWYEFGIASDNNNNNNNTRLLIDIYTDIKYTQKYTLNNNFPLITYDPIVIQKDSNIISYPIINTTLYYRKIDDTNNHFTIDKKTGIITSNDVISNDGSFDIEYCYLTTCNITTITYQIYDYLCYIEYNINPLIFTINQYNSYIPTVSGGKLTNINIIPNNNLPSGLIFNNNINDDNNNNLGEISGTYINDNPIVRYYNISCSTSGGNTFTPITLIIYPNINPLPTPPPSTGGDNYDNIINEYYNNKKNYLLLHYPLPILVDGFISNRTKISIDIWRYNQTLDLSFINTTTNNCPFSLTSQASTVYLQSIYNTTTTNNNNYNYVKSINCRIDNNQIIFDNFTVVNRSGLFLPFIIESKVWNNITSLPIYLTVWSNTSAVINKDKMIIPNDYIVGGNGSFCINYVDGCGICEGIEISCLLRLNMNILLYNNSELNDKDIYIFEKELNDKLNTILNNKYNNISTKCNIPSYIITNSFYNFSLECDFQRLDAIPKELVLSQIRYEIYKLIHNPYSIFYNSSSNTIIYINDESTPSTETFIPIHGNDYCEIYEDKSNSRGDCNYTVDENIIKVYESNKSKVFPTWAWILILILLLLLLLAIIIIIFAYYKHLQEIKRSKSIVQKGFAEIDQMKTGVMKANNNQNRAVALPIPSITEMRNRTNIIQGYVEIYINMKSWRKFYMVLVDSPYEILVYNSFQITAQGNVFVEIQEYIKLISIQNLECPAHGIKNNNNTILINVLIENDIYGTPFYSAKSNNTYTFILRCKNILEKSKWLEVINCIKSNNQIPNGIIGYGEKSTVDPIGLNYAIQPIQTINNNTIVNIPNQSNEYDDNNMIVPNNYFLRSTVKSKDSDDSITTPRIRGSSLTNKRSLSNNQFLPPQIPQKIQPNTKYVVSNNTELPSYYHSNHKIRSVSSPPRRPEIRLPDASNDVLTTDEIVEYCLRSKKN